MPTSRQPLTPRQLDVLRWIADGCPSGVWEGHAHKQSAGALESRNLIQLRRWYGKWGAVIKPDGEYYLEHGTYPQETSRGSPGTRPGDSRGTHGKLPREPQGIHRIPRGTNPGSVKSPQGRHRGPTETPAATAPLTAAAKPPPAGALLVEEILAAGGELIVEVHTGAEQSRHTARLTSARRPSVLPDGMQLVEERITWEKRRLQIIEIPAWMSTTAVSVPGQLRNPHKLVVALRDTDNLLPVEGQAYRGRALRLVQALVTTFEAGGHTVAVAKQTNEYGYRERRADLLTVTVRGHQFGLRLVQLKDRSDHVPTARELAEKERHSWSRIERYDYPPSGRFRIELSGRHARYGAKWEDTTRAVLEEKLTDLVHEIYLSADAGDRAHAAELERQRLEDLEHERQVARARERLIHAHRVATLDAQLTAWRHAAELREYLEELATVIAAMTDSGEQRAAKEWVDWARGHAARINPVVGVIAMPADPEPTRAALAPFLPKPIHVYAGLL